jgi:hypothetical protein
LFDLDLASRLRWWFGEFPFLRGRPITVTLVVSGKMYDAYYNGGSSEEME